MTGYVLKLVVLLPLLGLMIWGSLKLTKLLQARIGAPQGRSHRARLVETSFLGPGLRLAVVEFDGRSVLVGVSRHGMVRLSESSGPATAADVPAT